MSTRSLFGIIAALLCVILAFNSIYIVNEFQRGVKLQFGKVVDADIQPGIHIKWPLADNIRKFDARVLTLDAPAERFLTVEKKFIMVDSFAKWRIINVGKYYTATSGLEETARVLLEQRINDGLRFQFAQRNLHEVVSGERDQLMENITKQLNSYMHDSLGIEVIDVRVKKIDLPSDVSGPVFSRMAAEREKEAKELRSEGKEQQEIIQAQADRQRVEIESEAYRESELLRGEGDAQAANIYASAHNKDPEFYAFMRSLDAYKKTFANKGDILLLDPQSDFFQYLNDSAGK